MGTETATCNNSDLWDPDPALLECKFIYVSMPQLSVCCILSYIGEAITGAWIAALSGGVVAIVMVLTGWNISLSCHYHKEKKKYRTLAKISPS